MASHRLKATFFLGIFFGLTTAQFDKRVGDSCRTDGNKPGQCKYFDNCTLSLLIREPEPTICAWETDEAIVCCPTSGSVGPRRPQLQAQLPPGALARLRVGDSCRTDGNKPGQCKYFDNCTLSLLIREPEPTICAWETDEAIVCCPTSGSVGPRRPQLQAQLPPGALARLSEGKGSDILQKVKLSIKSYDECSQFYEVNARKLPRGLDFKSQLCAGDENKDTCEGDSGGPLQIFDNSGMPNIIGVTSIGRYCGVSPGVYTRVSHYVRWIEKEVWGKN